MATTLGGVSGFRDLAHRARSDLGAMLHCLDERDLVAGVCHSSRHGCGCRVTPMASRVELPSGPLHRDGNGQAEAKALMRSSLLNVTP